MEEDTDAGNQVLTFAKTADAFGKPGTGPGQTGPGQSCWYNQFDQDQFD